MVINNGGPAFPRSPVRIEHSSGDVSWFDEQEGMSLRDYFAGQVLALGSNHFDDNAALSPESIATRCYAIADAMLKARQQ